MIYLSRGRAATEQLSEQFVSGSSIYGSGGDLFTFTGYCGYWVRTWDIFPVMTKLHSDTILPERPFLGLSQISAIFSRLHFFYDRIAISLSREARVELLIDLLVDYSMRHSSLPLLHLAFSPDFPGPWTLDLFQELGSFPGPWTLVAYAMRHFSLSPLHLSHFLRIFQDLGP